MIKIIWSYHDIITNIKKSQEKVEENACVTNRHQCWIFHLTVFTKFFISAIALSDKELCTYNIDSRMEPSNCKNKYPCGICKVSRGAILYMKGLCPDDVRLLYDLEYYVHGVRDRRPVFQ